MTACPNVAIVNPLNVNTMTNITTAIDVALVTNSFLVELGQNEANNHTPSGVSSA